jgi:hypothetical protein
MSVGIKWETDAEKINVSLIPHMLFRNNGVDEFIDSENKYFIVASKGIGKTLLLNYKRYLLERRHKSDEKEGGMIFGEK